MTLEMMKLALMRDFPFSLKEQNTANVFFFFKIKVTAFFSSRACIFLVEYNYEAATKNTFPDLKMNPVHVFKSQLVQNCSYSAITLIKLRVS